LQRPFTSSALRRFVLDTNTASWLLKGHANVVARLKAVTPEDVCLSVVTAAELLYGAAKRPDARRLRTAVDEFLTAIDVLPWTSQTVSRFGAVSGLHLEDWTTH